MERNNFAGHGVQLELEGMPERIPFPDEEESFAPMDGEENSAPLAFTEGEFAPQGGDRVVILPVEAVYGNPNQPRKDFSEESLYELAESIKKHGVFSPILVSPQKDGRFMIIAGERRYRASCLAGLESIPVIIKNYGKKEIAEVALVENLQREDLNPIESAYAMKRLMANYGFTQEELAGRIGKSRSAVANTLRLLSLHKGVIPLVREGKLSSGHARALLPLPKEEQKNLALAVVKHNLSVREVEKRVKDFLNPKEAQERLKKELRKKELTVELKDLVHRMQRVFGTKVSLMGGENKGRFYLDYYTRDDLERIAEIVSDLEKERE
ncbi:MAG: ParB/RepB/Spo0J family partition protein [Clostridiales bacterium]|nr:ParB/RepB/Spo0J family partition protein [Clostridiales bacterium]